MAEEKNTSNLLDEIRKRADEYLAGWQRARADYENLERQTASEKSEIRKEANKELIMALLAVLDNMQKADEHKPDLSSCSPESQKQVEQWIKGVENIQKQMKELLGQFGVKTMDTVGRRFNPAEMEAVEQRKDDEKDDEVVLEEVLTGYYIGDKVLRPAKVIINNKDLK